MSPNPTSGENGDPKPSDDNGNSPRIEGGGEGEGNKNLIPLVALNSTISDEKTRYPIPLPTAVSTDDSVKAMKDKWAVEGEDYPGKPYKSKIFPKYYSDHNPVHFRILVVKDDD